jgi:hypothetical protein
MGYEREGKLIASFCNAHRACTVGTCGGKRADFGTRTHRASTADFMNKNQLLFTLVAHLRNCHLNDLARFIASIFRRVRTADHFCFTEQIGPQRGPDKI